VELSRSNRQQHGEKQDNQKHRRQNGGDVIEAIERLTHQIKSRFGLYKPRKTYFL
jgi:hypothetical protein